MAPFTSKLTFLFGFTEDGIVFVDGQQRDVVVVDDVLRVFEAVVGAQEVLDGRHQSDAELVDEQNVEHLSGSLVVARQASFAQFAGRAAQLPVDALYGDEDQPQ